MNKDVRETFKEIVKEFVEKEKCPTHNKSAKIILTKDGIQTKGCCCEEFHNILVTKCQEAWAAAIERTLLGN